MSKVITFEDTLPSGLTRKIKVRDTGELVVFSEFFIVNGKENKGRVLDVSIEGSKHLANAINQILESRA